MPTAGAVLCFHSVTTPQLPAEGVVHLPLAAWKNVLAAVRRVAELVPLRDLVRRHLDGRTTSGLVAVTFDDAYAAILNEVADVVYREAVPITIFVVTDAASTGARYWWDRIDDVFPRVSAQRWRAFEDACSLPDAYRRGQPAGYGPLRPLRQWLLARYAGRWLPELEPHLYALERETGSHTAHRSMTFEELERIAALPSVDIGAHTRSHPVLPLLPDADLRREVRQCYAVLRERFPRALPILAVPFGLFDKRVVETARAVGMTASLTLAGNTLRRHAGRDDLPRFCISKADSVVKLQLRLVGLVDWLRDWGAGALPRYPELPSPTT